MKVIRQTATVKAKGAKGNTVNKVSTKEPIKKYAVKKTSTSTPKNSSKKASTPSKAQKQKQKQAGSQKTKGKC